MNRSLKRVAAAALAGLLILAMAAGPAAAKDSQKGRWLKIRVYEDDSSTPRVLVNLPMCFVSAVMRILARTGAAHATIDGSIDGPSEGSGAKIKVKDLDLDEILKELESLQPGQIVEVQDDGERVSIWIE